MTKLKQMFLYTIPFYCIIAVIIQYQYLRFIQFHLIQVDLEITPPKINNEGQSRRRKADGTWNGLDIHYVNVPPSTPMVHCVGENFDNSNRSWLFRSCEYSNFCWDVKEQDFVVFRNDPPFLPHYWWSSTKMSSSQLSVAAGSQTKSWFARPGIGRFQPRVVNSPPPSGYYRLPNRTILPFYRHPTSHRNPGHIQWDEFLPLYVLLDIFDRIDDSLLLIQMKRPNDVDPTFDLLHKFLPLMGAPYMNLDDLNSSLKFFTPPKWNTSSDEAQLICADTALVGDGLFSDHGHHHWHGQRYGDRMEPYNTGKGGIFRRFRNWILEHSLKISPTIARRGQIDPNTVDPDTAPLGRTTGNSTGIPFKIVVSQSSSNKGTRSNLTFVEHIDALRKNLGSAVDVVPVELPKLSVQNQIELVLDATVYISAAGGSTATAMFLPKGAHLILFYHPTQYLDYDFWNNFPHLNVHWIGFWKNATNVTTTMLHSYPEYFAEFVRLLIIESEMQREPLEHSMETSEI